MKATLAIAVLFIAVASFAVDATQVPAVGSAAPSFKLRNQEGKKVSLKQYRGKWVVLYFYPKDFTSGCTVEARNFQRDLDKYTGANAVVLGVSLDSVDSHKKFCAKEALNFKLLSDTTHSVASKYGSTMEHEGQTYAARNTFLIDPKGVIRKVYVKVKPAEHSEQILEDLKQLKQQKG